MGTILITGASGFIGKALAAVLAKQHDVICISRKNPGLDLPYVRGNFSAFEDLRQLDRYDFDVVVHLAAVTGGCLERDGILVNVEGTRCLMRYMIDRGCKKFVMASSIAVVGFQSCKFRPLCLPIPDEHPCLDRHGYGLSKHLMEEITEYYQRQNEDIDVINLRLSSVAPDERMPLPARVCPLQEWSLGRITVMARSDAIQVFKLAAEAPYEPGVRIMNAAAPKAWVIDPVAQILRNWWNDDVDVSYFEQPGHEYDSVYDVHQIKEEINFVAKHLP